MLLVGPKKESGTILIADPEKEPSRIGPGGSRIRLVFLPIQRQSQSGPFRDLDTSSNNRHGLDGDVILPEVGQHYELTEDPQRRAICGISSGGICAWTVAWERPDAFRKVMNHVSSFVNIRGGYVYPALIRKTERKPIRVFIQDGSEDLDNQHGNWPLANQ